MISYSLSPYITFLESRLVPDLVQYGVAHRLTGEVLQPNERVQSLLLACKIGYPISLSEDQLNSLGADGNQLRQLMAQEFLVPQNYDLLSRYADWLVASPIQNPAITYRSEEGKLLVVRTSMSQLVFSPKPGELPEVIQEELPPEVAQLFNLVDGTRTLKEIFRMLRPENDKSLVDDTSFREAIEFLTTQDRQLIKFTSRPEDLDDPYKPVNTVPRNLYQSHRWNGAPSDSSRAIVDFHLKGIEEAWWEFDQIESTVNHAFRFPSEVLDGLDYGSRFCVAALSPEVLTSKGRANPIEVLEVGGGTGTFARSFIQRARSETARPQSLEVNYHILDLSPALLKNQRQVLEDLLPESRHFQQDATAFELPENQFDLIICNEVVADFFTARVERSQANALAAEADGFENGWQGDGAYYVERYQLPTEGAPDSFLVNAGALLFLEQCWKHLLPGGTLVISEYGGVNRFPAQAYHLNHEEFSIHFGHLAAGAAWLGFKTRILSLKEFLQMDFDVPVLSGREEHLICLNHVFREFGLSLPFAVISRMEFELKFGAVLEQSKMRGVSFAGLGKGFYFGPRIEDFMVLILNKPE